MIEILRSFFDSFTSDIDKYIDKYISLYQQQASKDNSEITIKKIHNDIEKLETKKDKLFDLYSDDAISKDDFKKRNEKLQLEIDSLKIDLDRILNSDKNIKNSIGKLNDIKKYFKQDIETQPFSETFLFELSKNIIDKIIINPISKDSAEVVFVPKFGNESNMMINRQNSDVSIGYITKKMLPIVTLKLQRFYIPHLHQREYKDIEYHLKLQI